jgi:hypothetical protein
MTKNARSKKRRFVQDDDDDDTYSLGSMENLVDASIPVAPRERLGLACNRLCVEKQDAIELASMLESVVALCARAKGSPNKPTGPDDDRLKVREYKLKEREKELTRREEQADLNSQESYAESAEQSNQIHELRGEVSEHEKKAKEYERQIAELKGELAKAKKTISFQEKDRETALVESEKKVTTLEEKCAHLEQMGEEKASSLRLEQQRGEALETERAALATKEGEMNRVIGEAEELRRERDELKVSYGARVEELEQMGNAMRECEARVGELQGLVARNKQLELEKEQEQRKKEVIYDKWVASKVDHDKTISEFDETMGAYGKSTYGSNLQDETEDDVGECLDMALFEGNPPLPLDGPDTDCDSATVYTESSFRHNGFAPLPTNTIDGEEKTALFLGKEAEDRAGMLVDMLTGAGMNPFSSAPGEASRFRARYRNKEKKKFNIVALVKDFYRSYLGIENMDQQSDEVKQSAQQMKKNMRYRIKRATDTAGKPLYLARVAEIESAAI